MDWFDILYTSKDYSFMDAKDFKNTMKTAEILSSKNDDSRVATIMTWLASNHILNDKHITKMNDAMLSESIDRIQNAVDEIYNKLSNLKFDDGKFSAYGAVIQKIVTTNGEFLSENYHEPEGQEYEAPSEDSIKDFIDGVRNLQASTTHKLSDLIAFVYNNELNGVRFRNFSKNKIVISNDLSIIVPIVTEVSDVRKYENLTKVNFYKSVLKDYDSDEEFVKSVGFGVDENLDLPTSFDQTNILRKVDSIQQNFLNKDDIAYSSVQKMLESMKTVRSQSSNLTKMFTKKKFGNYNVVLAINHYNAYNGYGSVQNNIITNDEEANIVEQGIDKCLGYIFTGYSNAIDMINNKITQYNNLLKEPFYINNKIKMNLMEVIPLWKDFFESDAYVYLAKSIDNDIEVRCNRLLTDNDYTVDINGKDEMVIGKKGILISNIIRNIVINRPDQRFESIMVYLAPKFAHGDTPVLMQLNAMIVILQYLTDFFTIPFKNKSELDAVDKQNMTFDAICNIVYYKDKHIRESFVYEGMFFGSYAIMEAESKLDYFNKLWKHIKDVFSNRNQKINIVKYVKDDADLEIPNDKDEKAVDSSVNNTAEQTLSAEQINNLKNASKEYLQAVDSLNGKQN